MDETAIKSIKITDYYIEITDTNDYTLTISRSMIQSLFSILRDM